MIGCYDKPLKAGLWLMALGIVQNGKLINNKMQVSITGKSRDKSLFNLPVMEPGLNQTHHFEYTWDKNNYFAASLRWNQKRNERHEHEKQ